MNDLSFIRLETTFDKAKDTRNSPVSSIIYNDAIQLLPNKTYVQVSNLKDGISFDGNYQVLLVNCKNEQLADITTKIAIEQFTDANGVPQIKYELSNLGVDFYKQSVHFKFKHTVSDAVWYSNPVIVSYYQKEFVTRFDYMNYDGTDVMKSISLRCYFETNDAESSSKEYTSIDGRKVTSRLILTEFEKYKFDRIDNFTYRRLNAMLSSSIIYVNGHRMTDKVVSQSKERFADTNVFGIDFKIAVDYSEEFTAGLQVFEPLEYDLIPADNNTITPSMPEYTVFFNRSVVITDTTIKARLYRNSVLVQTVTPTQSTNTLTLPFTYSLTNGEYYILIDSDKVTSEIGEVWEGITIATRWSFTVASGEFDDAEFSPAEFLTT